MRCPECPTIEFLPNPRIVLKDSSVTRLVSCCRRRLRGSSSLFSDDGDARKALSSTLWEYILPVPFSTLFSESVDQLLTNECLQGVVAASCLTQPRDARCTISANNTSPSS
jgi:hypothetical protein